MLPSSLCGLDLLRATEAAVAVHRDRGSLQHIACVLKMGNAGEAPKGERQICFPRTYFAKSEQQLRPKLQCFSPSVNNSSPEASLALSPTRGHPAGVSLCTSLSAKLSRFVPFLTIRRRKRSSWEGPWACSYCCFTHALGHPMEGLVPGREGTVAGGQGQPGRRGIFLTPALLQDILVRGGRGGEAAAERYLTGHLVVRL